ncbi:hypothetical protein BK138_35160 [Paenibacillus rhizosphaerae]|uniref:Uncharacterized protein n=1 Tax=Paenibacillus rhizosphaerae TaxID=297318 RepID=A0A1R1DX08_9BACL|nr:hypothetical protein BK138_35160 [Paenibacillus rhizosphaerae]
MPLFALTFPSVYIELTTYHPEMVSPKLMLSITSLREQAPLPTVIEVFIMEFMFEGLQGSGDSVTPANRSTRQHRKGFGYWTGCSTIVIVQAAPKDMENTQATLA